MAIADTVIKRIPESLLVEIVQFWEDTRLSELTISRYDREWKTKVVQFKKGTI